MITRVMLYIARAAFILWLVYSSLGGFLASFGSINRDWVPDAYSSSKGITYYVLGMSSKASRHWRPDFDLQYDPQAMSADVSRLLDMLDRGDMDEEEELDAVMSLADMYFVAGQYDNAVTVYRNALKADADHLSYADRVKTQGLALALIMKGSYDEAVVILEGSLLNGIAPSSYGFLQALEAIDSVERDSSLAKGKRHLVLAYIYRYMVVYDWKTSEKAVAHAEKAIDSLSGDERINAMICKAVALRNLGRHAESLEQLKSALALDPNNRGLHSRLSLAYGSLGEIENELKHLISASALATGKDSSGHEEVAMLAFNKFGDPVMARQYFEKALKLRGELRNTLTYVIVLQSLRDYDAAMSFADGYIAAHPDEPYGYNYRASTYFEMGRYKQAIAEYEKALEYGEMSAYTAKTFMAALTQDGRYDDALSAGRYILERDPGNATVVYNMMVMLQMTGRYKDAYEAAQYLLKIDPDNQGARRLLPYIKDNL